MADEELPVLCLQYRPLKSGIFADLHLLLNTQCSFFLAPWVRWTWLSPHLSLGALGLLGIKDFFNYVGRLPSLVFRFLVFVFGQPVRGSCWDICPKTGHFPRTKMLLEALSSLDLWGHWWQDQSISVVQQPLSAMSLFRERTVKCGTMQLGVAVPGTRLGDIWLVADASRMEFARLRCDPSFCLRHPLWAFLERTGVPITGCLSILLFFVAWRSWAVQISNMISNIKYDMRLKYSVPAHNRCSLSARLLFWTLAMYFEYIL